jgi:HAMP domain-containing protein
MELLLNLLWLTLVLPAVLIWRRQSACSRSFWHPRSFRAVVLLGCLMVLLFPVVSATDDLHPIRNEIEESSPSRRTAKQAAAHHTPDWNMGPPPAYLVQVSWFRPDIEACGLVSDYPAVPPERVFPATGGCRAPPSS